MTTNFQHYIADITFALDAFGVKPLFLVVFAVFLVTWIAVIDVRRTARAEKALRDEIEDLKAKLERANAAAPTIEASEIAEELPVEVSTPLEAKPELETTPAASSEAPTVESDVIAPEQTEPEASVFQGLTKTRSHFFTRLKGIFGSSGRIGAEDYEALEELLVTSDLGVSTTGKLLERLQVVAKEQSLTEDALKTELKSFLLQILDHEVQEILPQKRGDDPLVILVVGVNGVGKTTTIGKLSQKFSASGAKVLLGACDTFRAAAVEQLQAWGERTGVDVWAGDPEAKPSTVAYQAVHKAKDEGYDVLIVDTAGRLHTRVNLMNELENVVQILGRELPGTPHETLLVLDATTGQNALQQAREFNERAALSGLVITKLDGTPKGGIVVAIKDELGVPIRYIGVGEGAQDLKPFKADEFVEAIFADDTTATVSGSADAESEEAPKKRHRRVRARAV